MSDHYTSLNPQEVDLSSTSLQLSLNFLLDINIVYRMQERQVKEQQIEHAKKILKIQEQLKTNLSQVNISMLFLSPCYIQFTFTQYGNQKWSQLKGYVFFTLHALSMGNKVLSKRKLFGNKCTTVNLVQAKNGIILLIRWCKSKKK